MSCDVQPSAVEAAPICEFKSRSGWQRVVAAAGHSWRGLRAAVAHEAAFRQELLLVVPGIALAPWLAPGRWELVAMVGSLLLVLLVELLNSAIEAVADAVSTQHHPLIGRAKDMGSAAVLLSLAMAALAWFGALWPLLARGWGAAA
jgi:diacylglycerol kinase (ATP)